MLSPAANIDDIPLDILKIAMPEATLAPENMPKPELIAAWEDMVDKDHVKLNGKGEVIKELAGWRYMPDNCFSETDLVKNRIKFRFNVVTKHGVMTGKDGKPALSRANRPVPNVMGSFLMDCEQFCREYKAA